MRNQFNKKIYLLILVVIVMVTIYLLCRYEGSCSNIICKNIGLKKISFIDKERIFQGKERNLDVYVRYPASLSSPTQKIASNMWKVKKTSLDASICPKNKSLPLILFSHGYGCNAHMNSWLPEYLATHGYIVATVEHYGNTDSNIILELSARVWNRPQDLTFVLDNILEHPFFKNHIDKDRIGVTGFSQGGMTSLWVAGAVAYLNEDSHFKHMHTSPHIVADSELRSINEKFTQKDFNNANKIYRDDRIKAVFAIAPGFDYDNWLFAEKKSLNQLTIPVYLIAGESDDMVSVDEYSRFFANNIPQSQITIFPGKVTHWTFMNEGTELGKKEMPQFTIDDPSINRAEIHKKIGDLAVSFFNHYLK